MAGAVQSPHRDPVRRTVRAQWSAAAGRLKRFFLQNPVRLVPVGFLAVILLGAAMLMLPASRADADAPVLMPALFTSFSAVCVTGLITVDTSSFWTPFGQTVILALIQVGGFGIMTLSTLLALVIRKRLTVRTQLAAASETHTLNLGDVRRVLLRVAQISLTVEAAVAAVLTVRFWMVYDHPPGTAVWHGVFHAVSAFNNAGFSVFSDSLVGYVADPWIILPVSAALIVGGLGFPVIIELLSRPRTHRLPSMHLRLTLWGTAVLLSSGMLVFALLEWNRPETLGGLTVGGKLLGAFGLTAFPRTAGFNSIDYGQASSETLLLTDTLMFIGGGSAGTAGGIKITTFLILAFAIWNEVRGHDQVLVGARAISSSVQRQALSVALMGVGSVLLGTVALLALTDHDLESVLFECVSAFATVGLSTGITGDLPATGELVLIGLMFMGRVGTITIAAALALRTRRLLYRLPEERPIIG
ncbi:potassium transporter TrkG [Zhihengliuella alba]|uniref:Potassium transporter TrkG n=1 Tax=Zhihengliuella alba TaxID=547018 RepID=A0ABP7DLI3_9MICC